MPGDRQATSQGSCSLHSHPAGSRIWCGHNEGTLRSQRAAVSLSDGQLPAGRQSLADWAHEFLPGKRPFCGQPQSTWGPQASREMSAPTPGRACSEDTGTGRGNLTSGDQALGHSLFPKQTIQS